jgi:hypothetical protein
MKNSTLIRIKVPKALYESALKKALLEASDKEQVTGKGAKQGPEVSYSAKATGTKAPKSKEPMVSGKKSSYNDSTYSKKVGTKAIKEETSDTDGIADARFGPARSERDMEKDSQNLGEKKSRMEESGLMQAFQSFKELSPFLIPLAGFLGLSVGIVKNMIQYMKDNNLKGMKGFIEAYNVIGKGVSGQADKSRGINEANDKATREKVKASIQKQEKDNNKKTDDMIAKARAAKAAEEKKKKEMEAKKAADKKKADAAKKK